MASTPAESAEASFPRRRSIPFADYQSPPRICPSLGVIAFHHVTRLMPLDTVRTLPSARATIMTLVCRVWVAYGSHSGRAGENCGRRRVVLTSQAKIGFHGPSWIAPVQPLYIPAHAVRPTVESLHTA